MPKSNKQSDGLLDTWGRRNRTLHDKICPVCGKTFKPRRKASRFCSRPCLWSTNGGANKKKETWWINNRGYEEGRIWLDEHTQIRVKKHRWLIEKHLGRKLLPEEDVHHKDGNKLNNDLSNLEVIMHGEHTRLHNLERAKTKGGSQ